MATFSTFKYTQTGLDLQHAIEASQGTLQFTKFMVGSGSYSGSVRDLTALVTPEMTLDITRLQISGSGSTQRIIIGFDLDTTQVVTPFYLREIGLYAKDLNNNEILFVYSNSGDTADYIENTGSGVTTKLMNIELVISDEATITAVMDQSTVYVLANDKISNAEIDACFT